jgi:hypothetical protein
VSQIFLELEVLDAEALCSLLGLDSLLLGLLLGFSEVPEF